MTRKMLDCRDDPNQDMCTTAFTADTEEELMVSVKPHALNVHKYPDTPETWASVQGLVKDA